MLLGNFFPCVLIFIDFDPNFYTVLDGDIFKYNGVLSMFAFEVSSKLNWFRDFILWQKILEFCPKNFMEVFEKCELSSESKKMSFHKMISPFLKFTPRFFCKFFIHTS